MRTGWSTKDGAAVLGIQPFKFTQATEPAFRKVARLMLADPVRTSIELTRVMADVRAEQTQPKRGG